MLAVSAAAVTGGSGYRTVTLPFSGGIPAYAQFRVFLLNKGDPLCNCISGDPADAAFPLPGGAEAVRAAAFLVYGGTAEKDYTYRSGVLTIRSNTPLTIENAAFGTPTADVVFIEKDVDARLGLAGVSISARSSAAICIADGSAGDVVLRLLSGTGTNLRLIGGKVYAAPGQSILGIGEAFGAGDCNTVGPVSGIVIADGVLVKSPLSEE